ncbi:MAG: hypothetical protein ACLPJJ_02185 [Acidocella sp.]|uniref:hypothetical protein n=1 Tax=Acidocella sp. TaxID=50710 RepID=UPI003FD88D2A
MPTASVFLRLFVMAFVCLTLPSLAYGQPGLQGLWTLELLGSVGPYPVGVNITERDGKQFFAGHYFYASQCKNILLIGKVDGEAVTLTEPDGGVMHLHFVTNSTTPAGTVLDFYTFTGLQGTWTKGQVTLPVRLGFGAIYPGFYIGPWYRYVTDEPDAVFEARVRRFLNGVQTGNKAEAASAITFPLHVWNKTIATPEQFYAQWDSIFTPAYLAALRQAVPHEMFVHEGMAMLINGEAWFGPHGETVLQPP